MRLSERDAYIKSMIAKSPTYDGSGDMERMVGEEYDKHSQPLPEGRVWRWGGFLAMFRAGAEWATEGKQAEIDALKAQRDALLAALESAHPYVLGQVWGKVGLAIAKARGEL